MKLIYARDAVWTPWKNGGGVTRQIAAFPENAGLDDFGWRISTARVEAAGPFSHFAGIDRTLAVLEGRLRFLQEGRAELLMSANDPAISFAGEAAVVAEPMGSTVLDFNVMTRRGRFEHELASHRLVADERLEVSVGRGCWTLLYVVAGQPRVEGADQSSRLRTGDAVLLGETREPVSLVGDNGTALIIVVRRRGD